MPPSPLARRARRTSAAAALAASFAAPPGAHAQPPAPRPGGPAAVPAAVPAGTLVTANQQSADATLVSLPGGRTRHLPSASAPTRRR
jgi:hypothetical protein